MLTVAFSRAGDLFASGGADGQVSVTQLKYDPVFLFFSIGFREISVY